MIDKHNIPRTTTKEECSQWANLLDILRCLRSQDGCPWDQEQTIASLRAHIIEEPTELLDAISNTIDNPSLEAYELLKEEMGDVLLVLSMMMVIYTEEEEDAIVQILTSLNNKLIRRHPHVFGDVNIENPEQLSYQWQKIKTEQEGKKKTPLSEYKNYMHILERTKEIQKRISKEYKKLNEPLHEKTTKLVSMVESLEHLQELLPQSAYAPVPPEIEKSVGEALFSLIDIARTLKVSPTSALSRKIALEISLYQ